MKAILMVDIGDRKLDEVKVSYFVEDRNTNKGILIEFDCPLMPIPEKIVDGRIWFEDTGPDGYNTCIDEILRGNDENN